MTTRILEPADAATMLHERGVQPASVATPSAMTEALCRACGDHGLSVRSVPHDFDAIRAELAVLWPSLDPPASTPSA